eukprot:11225070-Lingulodinium_polyedra.AAC.1
MAQIVAGLTAVKTDGIIGQANLGQRVAAPLHTHENVAQMLAQDGVGDLAHEADGDGGIND